MRRRVASAARNARIQGNLIVGETSVVGVSRPRPTCRRAGAKLEAPGCSRGPRYVRLVTVALGLGAPEPHPGPGSGRCGSNTGRGEEPREGAGAVTTVGRAR